MIEAQNLLTPLVAAAAPILNILLRDSLLRFLVRALVATEGEV